MPFLNPEARREYQRKHYTANKATYQKQAAAWRAKPKNRERKAENSRAWHAANKDRYWAGCLMRKYGITATEYGAILNRQGGCCAICKRSPTSQRLHVDHCHTTDKVRGLLCSNCNTSIGLLGDDLDLIQTALEYVRGSLN